MSKTIADFPAYRIYQAYEGRKFKHGDKIALPFETRSHGTLWHFFRLGTVAGYAIERGEDPIAEIDRVQIHNAANKYDQHKLYWANACAVVLHNGPVTKEEVPGFNFGDTIILQGKVFKLEPDHNDNVKLVEA